MRLGKGELIEYGVCDGGWEELIGSRQIGNLGRFVQKFWYM